MRNKEEDFMDCIKLDDIKLFDSLVNVKIFIKRGNGLEILIAPRNEAASKIRVINDINWFGILAGEFFEFDLDECNQKKDEKYYELSKIIRNLINYGLEETGLVLDGKPIQYECIIPVPENPISVSRTGSVLPWKKRKAKKISHKYAPYQKMKK